MLSRFAMLSGEPMRDSRRAVSDSGLRRIQFRLEVAQERRRVLPIAGSFFRAMLPTHNVVGR
jgi:hypothetical protein